MREKILDLLYRRFPGFFRQDYDGACDDIYALRYQIARGVLEEYIFHKEDISSNINEYIDWLGQQEEQDG